MRPARAPYTHSHAHLSHPSSRRLPPPPNTHTHTYCSLSPALLFRFAKGATETEARESAKNAYKAAVEQGESTEPGKGLPSTSPIRLGLALNFSVFYYVRLPRRLRLICSTNWYSCIHHCPYCTHTYTAHCTVPRGQTGVCTRTTGIMLLYCTGITHTERESVQCCGTIRYTFTHSARLHLHPHARIPATLLTATRPNRKSSGKRMRHATWPSLRSTTPLPSWTH